MVYLYSLYACVCAIMCYSAFILQICLLCLYFLLLHLFCNYFKLCVDVVMDVATS